MKVDIENTKLTDSGFRYTNGSGWQATTLIAHSKEQKLQMFDLPLISVDISRMPFIVQDTYDIAYHMKRVMNTSLKYPVILNNLGFIIDGWHRIVKALLLEKESVKAVRFINDPPFDYVGKD